MQQLAALDGATVGRGPKHPTAPDPAISKHLTDFIRRHPFLRANRSYLAFLECYGGASLIRRGGADSLDISGFHGFGLDLEDDAPPAYHRGWFTFSVFAEGDDRRTGCSAMSGGFDFKVESWAVYLLKADGPRRRLFAPSFLAWLEELVRHRGSVAGWVV
jgi:hypothetical protein